MSRLVEAERDFPDHEELIFPCDCGDGDYLRVTWDPDIDWRYLWIEAHADEHGPFRRRALAAWKLLIGHRWPHSEIILTDKVVADLAAYLAAKVPAAP